MSNTYRLDEDDQFCPACRHDRSDHTDPNGPLGECSFGCPCFTCANCGEQTRHAPVMVDGVKWCAGCGGDEVANRAYDRAHLGAA